MRTASLLKVAAAALVVAMPLRATAQQSSGPADDAGGQLSPSDGPPRFAAADDESDQYQVEALIEGLKNPCGLLVRAGPAAGGEHEIFFSESAARRVVRFTTAAPDELAEVVVGFPLSTYGSGPIFEIGPLGLAFVDELQQKLAVGTGGLDDGQEVVQVYKLPEGDEPRQYGADVDHYVGPIDADDQGGAAGEGNFFGLARTARSLFVTANGDDSQGWVLKASTDGNSLADLQRFIATREATGATGPVGIAVNPQPNFGYMVVAQMGSLKNVRDSQLSFYSPSSGKLALNLPLGLYDAVALAYSPGGFLYAADFSWHDPEAGGVYRIDEVAIDGRQACQPVKIAAIARPTSLAFTPDGTLYVTAFSTGEQDDGDGDAEQQASGVIVKITGPL